MPRRIAILPDAVADQIAAGEVVERPASVVKELVENAIDAGATEVRVAIEQGGKLLVEVSDDGSGMGRDDAILALDRHATSKLRSAADLVGITSFGFRGEALPAIASVSRFTLQTHDGEGDGTELLVSGGRLEAVRDLTRRRGTTVIVRGLFFNVPARRKFLRSTASETRAVGEALATLALAHPAVGFALTADGEPRLLVPPGQSLAERIAGAWGRELAGTLVPVRAAIGSVEVEGFVQRPGDARPTGRRAQLFINGRPFKDPFLVRAAEAGYRSAIHPGDRPSLLLGLRVAPGDVDVNVHPAKLEVRFRDRIGVERAVEEAVRDALGTLLAAAPIRSGPEREAYHPYAPVAVPRIEDPPVAPSPVGPPDHAPTLLDPPHLSLAAPAVAPGLALPERVTQLFATYIAYEADHALILVDQHSAHERVLYEEVLATLARGDAASQRLLLPATVDLTDEEHDAIEGWEGELTRLGFEVAPFGGTTVVLHAVPSPHPRFDGVACFREVVADLARGRFGGWANRLERFAATYACRAAVKAGQVLGDGEMRALLARLFATTLPPHDVHGRATIVRLPQDELERRFGRR